MVAAWIKAETGVGPSMASGNQMCSGNMADFPAPPMKMKIIDQVIVDNPRNRILPPCNKAGPFGSVSVIKSKVPVVNERIRIPIRKSQIRKTGNNECLLGSSDCSITFIIESDKEIGRNTDKFPENIHLENICGNDQIPALKN